MSDFEQERVLTWLRRLRGELSQGAFAEAVSEATGWRITRDRYSKYESGALPFGGTVLHHFIDYAASVGAEPPDMTPPAPVLSLEERAVIAAETSARAAERQADAMERMVQAQERLAALMQLSVPDARRDEAAALLAETFGNEHLARTRPTHPGSPELLPGR